MNREEVLKIVLEQVVRDNEEYPILGNSEIDSLDLVVHIVQLEKKLDIALQTKAAFSRERSPFRTVGTLTDFIEELV